MGTAAATNGSYARTLLANTPKTWKYRMQTCSTLVEKKNKSATYIRSEVYKSRTGPDLVTPELAKSWHSKRAATHWISMYSRRHFLPQSEAAYLTAYLLRLRDYWVAGDLASDHLLNCIWWDKSISLLVSKFSSECESLNGLTFSPVVQNLSIPTVHLAQHLPLPIRVAVLGASHVQKHRTTRPEQHHTKLPR